MSVQDFKESTAIGVLHSMENLSNFYNVCASVGTILSQLSQLSRPSPVKGVKGRGEVIQFFKVALQGVNQGTGRVLDHFHGSVTESSQLSQATVNEQNIVQGIGFLVRLQQFIDPLDLFIQNTKLVVNGPSLLKIGISSGDKFDEAVIGNHGVSLVAEFDNVSQLGRQSSRQCLSAHGFHLSNASTNVFNLQSNGSSQL